MTDSYFRLRHVNEKIQRDALKEYYSRLKQDARTKKIEKLQRFGRVTYPVLCVFFVCGFWILGMAHNYNLI